MPVRSFRYLNFHDYLVVTGMIPAENGRIPLSDGAGEVVAIGAGVTGLAVGDAVVSTFSPGWIDGLPPRQAWGRSLATVATAMSAKP